MTLPQSSPVAGQAGHINDHNNIRGGLAALWGAAAQQQYNVLAPPYSAKGDYSTDDTVAIQNAVDAASAAGGGRVLLGQHVVSGAGIVVKSGVTIAGIPGYSKLKNSGNNTAISSSVAASGVAVQDLIIEGPVTNTVTVPTRARTTSGAGTTTGIWIDGSLDTTAPGAPVITDVVIRNVVVRNCTSLPIRVFGVTGRVLVEGCSFHNCMDAGFGFNQEVICVGNHSLMSQDNGISISRGNNKVTCTGNTIELAAYHGIWLSGFTGSSGPNNFSCTGNTVYDVGECGILLQDAPKYGNVSGNTVNKNYRRGEAGGPTDTYVSGIMIRGNSTTPGSPGTSIAYGLKVTGNTIIAACDAGISYDGATSVAITDNLILDCGTNLKADNITVIGSSSTTQNIGILCQQPATAVACIVRNNDVIDQRATPYTNFGMFPVHVAGVTAIGNTMTGCRNSSNLGGTLTAYNDGRMDAGQETIPRWAASVNTISMPTGTVRLAYFVARRNATVTAVKVWSGGTAAGATPTLVKFGLYSVDSSGNLTLMSATASDTSIFASAATAYSRNLLASQAVQADQLYAIAAIVVTSAATPTVDGCTVQPTSDTTLSPALCFNLTGQTDLPASITFASLTATGSVVYAVAVGA